MRFCAHQVSNKFNLTNLPKYALNFNMGLPRPLFVNFRPFKQAMTAFTLKLKQLIIVLWKKHRLDWDSNLG